MEQWAALWYAVLIFGIAVFAALSVYVIVGGFFDVRRMFAELERQRDANRSGSAVADDDLESG